MHVNLTPIFGQRRNAQAEAGVGCSMVLKKNIYQACQGAPTVFCTLHAPRICREHESLPGLFFRNSTGISPFPRIGQSAVFPLPLKETKQTDLFE